MGCAGSVQYASEVKPDPTGAHFHSVGVTAGDSSALKSPGPASAAPARTRKMSVEAELDAIDDEARDAIDRLQLETDVEAFLLALQVEEYVDPLARAGVTEISELQAMTEADLSKIVPKPGHVKKIMKKVAVWDASPPTELTSPSKEMRTRRGSANAELDALDDEEAADFLEAMSPIDNPGGSAVYASDDEGNAGDGAGAGGDDADDDAPLPLERPRVRSVRTSYDELPDFPDGEGSFKIEDDEGEEKRPRLGATVDRPITPERLEKMQAHQNEVMELEAAVAANAAEAAAAAAAAVAGAADAP